MVEGTPPQVLRVVQDDIDGVIVWFSVERNVLLGYVRRGAVTVEQAKTMGDPSAGSEQAPRPYLAGALDTALECDLSAYDAEFVVLARTLGVPLVTLDGGF